MILGRHVSIGSSIANSVEIAKDLKCNAIQIFTRNPRGWHAKELTDAEIEKFKSARKAYKLDAAVAHMPYLPNFASPNKEVYEKSVESLVSETKRCESLGIEYLVLHLGSHLGKGRDDGVKRIVDAVSQSVEVAKHTKIVLENQAGSENSMGSRIEDLVEIDRKISSKKVGFCIDTCHAFAAGYDIRSREIVEGIVKELGNEKINVVHLNDAKFGLGSKKDWHANIGFGEIGKKGIENIVRSSLGKKVLILETPVGESIGEEAELGLVAGMARKV